MAVRTILHYPDKRLREQTQPVTRFDAELASLLEDMAETMYAAPGVGLAAPQIGVPLRIFVVDIATGEDQPSDFRVFINPELLDRTFPGGRPTASGSHIKWDKLFIRVKPASEHTQTGAT